ncbi:MAG: hypothetical protein WAQ98_18335 [Blastocatellia bacterium]
MLNHLTIKEGVFRLEVCQSQCDKSCYFAVVFNAKEAISTQEFNNLETATKKGRAMLEAIVTTAKYRKLADNAYQKALFAEEDGQQELQTLYLKEAAFYEQRYLARKAMSLGAE